MQRQIFEDRRIFERISVNLPAQLRDPSDYGSLEVSCQNISANGMEVVSSQVLLPNASLEICLDLRDKREPLHLYGKVIWSERIEEDKWRAGICFDEPQFMTLSRIFIKRTLLT